MNIEYNLPKEYEEYFNQANKESAKLLGVIVQKELERERADKPIKKRRQLMAEMFPHLEVLTFDNINQILWALDGNLFRM